MCNTAAEISSTDCRNTFYQTQPSYISGTIRSLSFGCVFQGVLTKGLQNTNGLVQQATLSVLCSMLSALERTLSSLDRAQRQAQNTYNDILSSQHTTEEETDTGKPPVRKV